MCAAQCTVTHKLMLFVFCVVLGQIRTTIGQAQLLVNKKLKQFLGLCQDAEVRFSLARVIGVLLQSCMYVGGQR